MSQPGAVPASDRKKIHCVVFCLTGLRVSPSLEDGGSKALSPKLGSHTEWHPGLRAVGSPRMMVVHDSVGIAQWQSTELQGRPYVCTGSHKGINMWHLSFCDELNYTTFKPKASNGRLKQSEPTLISRGPVLKA